MAMHDNEHSPTAAEGASDEPITTQTRSGKGPNEGDLSARVAELEAEIATLRDQALRAYAEQENTRKRTQREIEDTRKYAVSGFARELLLVADNLRRALDMAPVDPDPSLKNFLIGIEATERQLATAFEKVGIRRMEPIGKPADPNYHQIMIELDGGDAPPMTVVQVLQDGYMIHERLLREALVGVAKRPSGAPPQTDTHA